MERQFLDTNIIIRYLTNDDPTKAERARALFQATEQGTITLLMSESIVVEAVQVLSSRALYNLPRAQVVSLLSPILGLRGLRLPYKRTHLRALALWSNSSVDFVDALTVAQMERQKIPVIASFDHDFRHFPQISRQEP